MGASFSLAAHRLKQGLAASGQRKTRQVLAGFWLLVIPARFERATVCLEGRCSIQLSYGTEGAKIGRFRGKKPDRIGRMTNLDRIMRIQGFCPDAQEAWYFCHQMVNALKSLWIIALLGTSLNLCAQGGSDAQAKKAAFASAILPGAGQFVNHQAWKAPIAWGILAGSGYFLYTNQSTLNRLNTAIDIRFDTDPTTTDEFVGRFTDNQLFTLKNETRRSRDYAILGVGAAYLFQVLDAYSSGFLVHFDVSPTLVGSVSPCPQPLAPLGAKIQLSWP